jgi:hypothetical protein
MSTPELAAYIQSQLQSGGTADTIAAQLRTAGWQEADITAGFTAAHLALSPSQAQPSQAQLPPPLQQGRMKTGWMLFKQSLSIIKNNPGLSRYVVISMLWSIAIFAVVFAVYLIDALNAQLLTFDTVDEDGQPTKGLTLLGLLFGVLWLLVQYTVTYFYATGLSAQVLALFRGTPTTYAENIKLARSKLGPIITFAALNLLVGYILGLIQRIRFIGWIVSRLLGVIWNLATLFSIPLIADTSAGGVKAAKESILLFKQTWGESIVSRVSMGGLFFLIYLAIMIPATIVLSILFTSLFGVIGFAIIFFLIIISLVFVGLIETLATNILNVALYYYAKYRVIPPNFSPELLASVFKAKK